MKRILKTAVILIASLVLAALLAAYTRAEGVTEPEYLITQSEGEYVLSEFSGGVYTETGRSRSLDALVGSIRYGRVNFDGIIASERITLLADGRLTLGGALFLTDSYGISAESGEVVFSSFELTLEKGAFRNKGATVLINGGRVSSERTAFLQDFSDTAVTVITDGEIVSTSLTPAVSHTRGLMRLSGGEISSYGECAVDSSATLEIGEAKLSSSGSDIFTENPVRLINHLSEELSLTYKGEFSHGEMTEMVFGATREDCERIRVFDKNGREHKLTFFESSPFCEERNFCAVYIPFTVTFKSGEDIISITEVISGKTVNAPDFSPKDGFEFGGWYTDAALTAPFRFEEPIFADTTLFASVNLSTPTYRISSSSFVYDGAVHFFSLDLIDHPLLSESTVVYEWYKDGLQVASGEKLALKNAADTGRYSCKISLYHDRYSVGVTTPEVLFSIEKSVVAVPQIPKKEYTGERLFPGVASSTLYSVHTDGGIDRGEYPVVLSLLDSENYRWDGHGEKSLTLSFEIERAKNCFVNDLTVFDIYFLAENTFFAKSKFGDVRFVFYSRGSSVPLSEPPTVKGDYSVVALVDETLNYEGLRSEVKFFRILEEEVLGISIVGTPFKSVYTAFENFSPAGISVNVSYSSGRSETLGAEVLSVKYQSADSLRVRDNAVFVSYRGASARIPVTVNPASYDISGVRFSDYESEYSGSYVTAAVPEALPVGLDGISLSARVEGGGVNVGEYTVRLVFSTDSPNYSVPDPLFAKVTVRKKTVRLVWNSDTFVYNGKKQGPSAYFLDTFGTRIWVSVEGAEYDAGDSYTARAKESPNYDFENAVFPFSIRKADFDLSGLVWSDESFVYDGQEHTVTLSGLPAGLRVTGYADNAAVNAGTYYAVAGVSYDERNYNPPKIEVYEWTVERAQYDMTAFSFSDSTGVFDGREHFPDAPSSMPVGADGIMLEYSFSRGAVHVKDGRVEVTVTFFTKSSNYLTPDPIIRTAEILPCPISVSWWGLDFVYDGTSHAPSAAALECEVLVEGAMTDAGEYMARAVSLDSDYSIENSEIRFTIAKAANAFTSEPYARDVFEGREADTGADALFGTVEFEFFTDAELSCRVDFKGEAGEYFAVPFVKEGTNYLELRGEAIPFEVIRVVPVGISVLLKSEGLYAFERLSPSDFEVYTEYNDGTKTPLSHEAVEIIYQNGDSLRVRDTEVRFSHGDFECTASVSVERAVYDTSAVVWTGLSHVYDGKERYAEIEGLPVGVTLLYIEGNGACDAGEYVLTPVLDYDAENYEPPIIEKATMRIEKATVKIPTLEGVVYTGTPIVPDSGTPLWIAVHEGKIKDAGTYKVSAIINDAVNYEFEDGTDRTEIPFTVFPREIIVAVGDRVIYLFEEYENPEVSVLSGLAAGDTVDFVYSVNGDVVSVESLNSNYKLNVIPGKITKSYLPAPEVRGLFTVLLLLIVLLILLLIIAVLKRDSIILFVKGGMTKRALKKAAKRKASIAAVTPQVSEKPTETEDNPHLESFNSPVDTSKADALISNSFAKDLLATEKERVYTYGHRRTVVNIDTLGENFSAGERVDVNSLKSMSLVPYDTAYVKVLARGMIDKPLFVYANEFSSTAVKMLALTGGRAIKVSTVRIKNLDTEQTENNHEQ